MSAFLISVIEKIYDISDEAKDSQSLSFSNDALVEIFELVQNVLIDANSSVVETDIGVFERS